MKVTFILIKVTFLTFSVTRVSKWLESFWETIVEYKVWTFYFKLQFYARNCILMISCYIELIQTKENKNVSIFAIHICWSKIGVSVKSRCRFLPLKKKIKILWESKWKIYLTHRLIIPFYFLIQRFKDWRDLSESELFPGLESQPLKRGAHCNRCGHLGEYRFIQT